MEVIINEMKTTGFIVDDRRKIQAPMYFEQSQELKDKAKRIFKKLVEYAIKNNTAIIPGDEFRKIVARNYKLDKYTLLAIAELNSNQYIQIITR